MCPCEEAPPCSLSPAYEAVKPCSRVDRPTSNGTFASQVALPDEPVVAVQSGLPFTVRKTTVWPAIGAPVCLSVSVASS